MAGDIDITTYYQPFPPAHPCPTCGTCPTCGARTAPPHPLPQPYVSPYPTTNPMPLVEWTLTNGSCTGVGPRTFLVDFDAVRFSDGFTDGHFPELEAH